MAPYRPRHPQWPWAAALAAVVVSLAMPSLLLLLFDAVAPAATLAEADTAIHP